MNDNHVQTNSPGFRLIPETATFLDLCIVACCGWIFIRLAAKIKGGATKELDETILRMLRHRDNLAIPRGPKWLSHASHDITSLGSGTNLTLASGIAVGFLCLQRRIRAAGFLIVSLGSGLMLSYLLKNFFLRERPTVVPRLTHFDPGSFPSGHSMGAALVYLTLGGIISRQTRRLLSKAYFLSVALALSVLVGISRIYLGVHFPSDVLDGRLALSGQRFAHRLPDGCNAKAQSNRQSQTESLRSVRRGFTTKTRRPRRMGDITARNFN